MVIKCKSWLNWMILKNFVNYVLFFILILKINYENMVKWFLIEMYWFDFNKYKLNRDYVIMLKVKM